MTEPLELIQTTVHIFVCPRCGHESDSVLLDGNGIGTCYSCDANLGSGPFNFVSKVADAVRCDVCGREVALTRENRILSSPDYARAVGCICNDSPDPAVTSSHIVAVQVGGQWVTPESVLHEAGISDGIREPQSDREWATMWMLVHEAKFERSEFRIYDETTKAKVLWKAGESIGYLTYTEPPHPSFPHPTLHQIYVRKPHRRKGNATRLVNDFLGQFPAGPIVVESPIREMRLLLETLGLVKIDAEGNAVSTGRLRFARGF